MILKKLENHDYTIVEAPRYLKLYFGRNLLDLLILSPSFVEGTGSRKQGPNNITSFT
jgi:hypothetical protein